MADPFLGQLTIFAGTFAPRNWSNCDGQIVAISQYTALFSLLSTNFGGDGRTTFGLPDMRSRIPVHIGQGSGLAMNWRLGTMYGTEGEYLSAQQIPPHTHDLMANGYGPGSQTPSAASVFGSADANKYPYGDYASNETMADDAIKQTGGGAAHTNIMPSTVVRFIISMTGTYPTRP